MGKTYKVHSVLVSYSTLLGPFFVQKTKQKYFEENKFNEIVCIFTSKDSLWNVL